MASTSTWLRLKPLILDRMRAKVGIVDAAIQVLQARDLTGVKENAQPPKSVQLYGPLYRPVDDDGVDVVQVEHTYFIVVAIRNPADQKGGTAADEDASPICDAILRGFVGWRPGAPFGRMKLGVAPPPVISPGGFAYYPFGFTTRTAVKGDPN